jgi:hypothetical protein
VAEFVVVDTAMVPTTVAAHEYVAIRAPEWLIDFHDVEQRSDLLPELEG